ncbi:hypothetical protein MBLNU459_g5412t1 [Dothideomycetes sp. NU459]
MPMNWDGEADRKLLLAILKTHAIKVDSDAIAADLSTESSKCTPRAVEERLKKLKKMASGSTAETTGDGPVEDEPTPDAKPKSTPRRKKAAVADDGDDDDPTPTKKARKTASKSRQSAPFIMTNNDNNDDIFFDKLSTFIKKETSEDKA